MTKSTGMPAGSRTSNVFEDFLALPDKRRAGRLLGTRPLVVYHEATLSRHGDLRWNGPRQRGPSFKKLPSRLCFDFAQLADSSEERIRRFASKWGPLGREV